jgi:hypothetical protein
LDASLSTPTSDATVSPSAVPPVSEVEEESHFFRNLFFFVTLLAFAGATFAFFGGLKKLKKAFVTSRGRYSRVAEDDVEK